MEQKFTPLPGSFMLVAMFGFLLSVFFIKDWSLPWAFVVGTFSVILFMASLLSMTYAPVEDEILLDKPRREQGNRVEFISAKEAVARQKGKSTKRKRK